MAGLPAIGSLATGAEDAIKKGISGFLVAQHDYKSIAEKIINLLKDLQRQFNLTYLFIAHDLSVIKFMCDRVVTMRDGTII